MSQTAKESSGASQTKEPEGENVNSRDAKRNI
jgi:hypothetical protein